MASMGQKLRKSLIWIPLVCIVLGAALLVFIVVGVVRRYDFVRTFTHAECSILSARKSCLYVDDQVIFSGYTCWLLNVSNPVLQAQNKTAPVQYSRFADLSLAVDGCTSFSACGSVVWPCVYNPKNILEIYLKISFPVSEVILVTILSLSLVVVGLYMCIKRFREQREEVNVLGEESSPF
jgi:hypothetical protein